MPGPGIYKEDALLIAPTELLLRQARELAAQIKLPDEIPAGDNLEIGDWFDELQDREPNVSPADAIWRRDLDTAFYVALFLRGAEYSIRYRVPLHYF